MHIKSGVGVSTQNELPGAAREAAEKASRDLRAPQIVLIFATHNYPAEKLLEAGREVRAVFPEAQVAGGLVNGFFFEERHYDVGFHSGHGVAVLALGGEGLRAAISLVSDPRNDPAAAGRRLASEVQEQLGAAPDGGLLFSLGLSAAPRLIDQELVEALCAELPQMRLLGSGFCGGIREDGTFLPGAAFWGERQEPLGAMLIAFCSKAPLSISVANGLRPAGRVGVVTKAEGGVIQQIDGRSAKEVLLEKLPSSPEARELFSQNPAIAQAEVGITLGHEEEGSGFYWGHALGPWSGEGFFDVHAREGMTLASVRITPQSCLGAVREAGESLQRALGSKEPELVFAVSCGVRGFVLGAEVTREETELRRYLTPKRFFGIVANGELSSYHGGAPRATAWVYTLMGIGG